MPEAMVGVVGLRAAGKTVYHATLYGRPSPLDRPGVTLAFPPRTQRVLEERWQQLESGEDPGTTGLIQHDITWELELPATGVEWTLNTSDAGGEFYASVREEDVDRLAGPIDAFVAKCDAILYLIDASDDKLLTSQLGTLRRVLTFNKRKVTTGSGLKARPVCLVFTKAESYVPKLGTYILNEEVFSAWRNANVPEAVLGDISPLKGRELSWEELFETTTEVLNKMLSTNDERGYYREVMLESARIVVMNRDRAALVEFLKRRDAGKQFLAFYANQCLDRGLYETFPVSCIQRTGTAIKVAPKRIHEPILWAVERILAARGELATERSKARRKFAAVAFAMMLLAAFGGWLYGHLDAGKRHDEVQVWRDSHAGPEHAKAREEKGRELLAQTFVRFPFVSNAYLTAQQQTVADDKAKHHRFLYDGVVAQVANLHREQGKPSLKSQAKVIEDAPDFDGPLNYEYISLRDQKREEHHEFEFGLLKDGADSLAVQNQYEECFRHISASFLMKVESWRPKVVALLAEKKKARLDGEMDRLARLAKGIIEKADEDSDDADLTAAVEDFGKTFLKDEPSYARRVQELSSQVKDRRELFRRFAYTRYHTKLYEKLKVLSGKHNSGSRVSLIESTKPPPFPEEMPVECKPAISQCLQDAKGEEEEYEVQDILFASLDKMTKPEQSREARDMLSRCKFLTGRFKGEIQERKEALWLREIRYAEDQKSDAVPGLCRAFLKECPDSKLKNVVQLAHDNWAWNLAVKGETDANLTFPDIVRLFKAYEEIEYASRKETARQKIAKLERAWDKKDYDHLQSLSPIDTWDKFEKAEGRAKAYLAGERSVRAKREEVEGFLKSVQAYDAGVKGLELVIDEVNLSDANDLSREDRPKLTLHICWASKTKDLSFNSSGDMQEKLKDIKYTFKLDRSNEHRGDDNAYTDTFKTYSGRGRYFSLSYEVIGRGKYQGFFSTGPTQFDLGDDLFTGNEGKSVKKMKLTFADGKRELEFEYVIRWKGSTLCNLCDPKLLPPYNLLTRRGVEKWELPAELR